MEKRALQLASVASMIDQFNIPNIQILQSLGYKVDVVADFTNPGTITAERAKDLKRRLEEMDVRVFDIPIPRSLNLAAISSAYKKVKKLLNTENYILLHCHSPIGGAIARQAARGVRKNGLKVIYTAHGFHFYDGAPLKNWLLFYPIEKKLSRITDVLITINKEDYNRASTHFCAKKTVYIPGIGVDIEKFRNINIDREAKRAELGIMGDDLMLLSVGEQNKNKNHKVVVEAISLMDERQRSHLHYFIVGKDAGQRNMLVKLAEKKNIHLHLLGFRTDIPELLKVADVFLLPSIREGLNVGLMEAMASGVFCIAADIRGNRDLLPKDALFNPVSSDELRKRLLGIISKDSRILDYSDVLSRINRKSVDNKLREEYMHLN